MSTTRRRIERLEATSERALAHHYSRLTGAQLWTELQALAAKGDDAAITAALFAASDSALSFVIESDPAQAAILADCTDDELNAIIAGNTPARFLQ